MLPSFRIAAIKQTCTKVPMIAPCLPNSVHLGSLNFKNWMSKLFNFVGREIRTKVAWSNNSGKADDYEIENKLQFPRRVASYHNASLIASFTNLIILSKFNSHKYSLAEKVPVAVHFIILFPVRRKHQRLIFTVALFVCLSASYEFSNRPLWHRTV